MSTQTENACLRCRTDCVPLANLSADGDGKSFVCVGLNKKESRTVAQVTDKIQRGDTDTKDATLHSSDAMIARHYDRSRSKKATPAG